MGSESDESGKSGNSEGNHYLICLFETLIVVTGDANDGVMTRSVFRSS